MKAGVDSLAGWPNAGPGGGEKLYRRRMRGRRFAPGFTLVELMVSVGILLILLTMVGTIFSMASKASSQATAHNEIMANFRALRRQLESDLLGLQKDQVIAMWHQLTEVTDPVTGQTTEVRTDRLAFLAAGDFQTVEKLWDYQRHTDVAPNQTETDNRRSVRSNAARIFYGQELNSYDQAPGSNVILARRSKLLIPDVDSTREEDDGFDDDEKLSELSTAEKYDAFEYENKSLTDWQNFEGDDLTQRQANFKTDYLNNGGYLDEDAIVSWIRRPTISNDPETPKDETGFHMQMVRGCVEFKVQRWREYNDAGVLLEVNATDPAERPRWWPEEDSDFASGSNFPKNLKRYFNGIETSANDWEGQPPLQFPRAIKVTVRLVDSNQRIKDGEEFTMVFSLK